MRIALGVRSDRLQGDIVNIGPMTRKQLRTAIVQPAKKVFLRFEEGLDARILTMSRGAGQICPCSSSC